MVLFKALLSTQLILVKLMNVQRIITLIMGFQYYIFVYL